MRRLELFRYLFRRGPRGVGAEAQPSRVARIVKSAAGLVVCIAGAGAIVWGVWEIYRPAGIIAGGVALVLIGWLLDSLGGE